MSPISHISPISPMGPIGPTSLIRPRAKRPRAKRQTPNALRLFSQRGEDLQNLFECWSADRVDHNDLFMRIDFYNKPIARFAP
jgi:hypothetical protein